VAIPAVAPVTSTDAGTVQVTALDAPAGPVTEHVKSTVPVNPFDGMTLTKDVFPVVAPVVTVMVPLLLSAKLGEAATDTTCATKLSVCTYSPVESWPVIRTLLLPNEAVLGAVTLSVAGILPALVNISEPGIVQAHPVGTAQVNFTAPAKVFTDVRRMVVDALRVAPTGMMAVLASSEKSTIELLMVTTAVEESSGAIP
jgi:hypothetical protein